MARVVARNVSANGIRKTVDLQLCLGRRTRPQQGRTCAFFPLTFYFAGIRCLVPLHTFQAVTQELKLASLRLHVSRCRWLNFIQASIVSARATETIRG
jgi:hypothetical protein